MNKQPIDPREWDLQERALREARDGAGAASDPTLARYRAVAQALRRAPEAGPPADFAASVAAHAARATAADARLERWLLRGLALVFACAALAVVALYGREWIDGFALLLPAAAGPTALNWLLAVAACVALSWSFGRLRATPHPP